MLTTASGEDSNMGVPEPPEPESPVTINNDLAPPPADTDSDDSDAYYDGYERLPQQDVLPPDDDEEDEEDEAPTVEEDRRNVRLGPIRWAQVGVPPPPQIEMDDDKVEEVKEAMMNVTLPPGNIPEWARNVPEEEWKAHLMNRLSGRV